MPARHPFAPVPTLLAAAFAAAFASPVSAADVTDAELQAVLDRLAALEARLGGAADGAAPSGGTPLSAPAATAGTPAPDGAALLAALDQRLRILERKLEIQQEDATAKAATAPVVAVNDRGVSIKSAPPGDYEFRIRGLVQADHRLFMGDDEVPLADGFLFRRIRPTFEGTLGPLVAWRLTPEFAGDSATIVDAYVDVRFDPRATLRVGKVKGPIGLERLQSGSAIEMIERGFPTELAPNRDIGVQLQGEFAGATVSYVAGVYNGTPDGRDAPTTDPDGNLEFAGRLWFEPWKNAANAGTGLGFGLGASTGEKEGAGNNFLPRYRTPGQNVFFQHRSTVLADGDHTRFSPQAHYYRNAFSLMGEWIRSRQAVALTGIADSGETLSHEAWALTAGWVLTGEDATFRGVVKPNHPFTLKGDGWGAFELVARAGELDVDDDAFPLYADPATAASAARMWGLGLNWYLTSNLKLVFNHTRTSFDGGAVDGDREDESTFFSRLQVAF